MFKKGSFGYDLEFLKKHHPDLVLLEDETRQAQLIVLPAYQGRAMTSTLAGASGASFGWVNHELIESGEPAEHMHVFGGEDRFWMGPEGGQFSIFFKKGVPFTFEHWFVPKELDTEPFQLISNSATQACLEKSMRLENYSGTVFDLKVERNIRLLDRSMLEQLLDIQLPEALSLVGFESENILQNNGREAWNKATGLLSIWIASMMNASPQTTVAIPYRQGEAAALGKIVTSDYFGQIPADRLQAKDGLILFKADARQRGKIGLSPERATSVAGAWDAANGVLTLAQFSLPKGKQEYVNSLWELQEDPFAGDVINSYNDGPNDTGKQMGAFYELESSSPAAALRPGESIRHCHRIMHLKGAVSDLNQVAKVVLGGGFVGDWAGLRSKRRLSGGATPSCSNARCLDLRFNPSTAFFDRSRLLLDRSVDFFDRSNFLLDRSVAFFDRSNFLLDRSVAFFDRSRLLLDRSVDFFDRSSVLIDRSLDFIDRSLDFFDRSRLLLDRSVGFPAPSGVPPSISRQLCRCASVFF